MGILSQSNSNLLLTVLSNLGLSGDLGLGADLGLPGDLGLTGNTATTTPQPTAAPQTPATTTAANAANTAAVQFLLQTTVQQLLLGNQTNSVLNTLATTNTTQTNQTVIPATTTANTTAQLYQTLLGQLGTNPNLNPIIFATSVLAQQFQIANGTGTPL